MNNQLNTVTKEKHELSEKAQHLIKTIRQMERSLDDATSHDDDGMVLTYPLLACLQHLKEKHQVFARLHRERFEQVRKLVEALESYASHLEPAFLSIKLPPTDPQAKLPPTFDLSANYVASLDGEFTRVYEEYNKRLAIVTQTADEIISLWSELGTPQAQVDSNIVQFAREAPEQLGLHGDDLRRLVARKDKLIAEKAQRERRLKELRVAVEGLWNRLGVTEAERKQFLAGNRGCGLRQINEFEDELSRLNELKKQNLHLFVEDARFKLQELWDNLYFSEEEMLDFAPAFSDVYSDALLSAHEQEIVRLEALKEQRAPILAAIDKHRSLIKDRADLETSSQDASRLMAKGNKGEKRDPGKLLREEKMRKRIAKDLPKVEAELRRSLEAWEDEYGRPFCVHGQRYVEELELSQARAPPPRSKTPNALQLARDAPKSGGRAPASQPQSRNGTTRGVPSAVRSKTPTAASRNATWMSASTMSASTMNGPMSASTMNAPKSASGQMNGKASPSKIPGASRLPMGSLRDGNNSPERRPQGHKPTKSQPHLGGFKQGGGTADDRIVACGPPPRMRDLFIAPTPTPGGREQDDGERSTSVVRHVALEDPYRDPAPTRNPYQDLHSSAMGPPPRPHYARNSPSHDSYASSGYAASSTTTTTTTTLSRPMSRAEYPHAPSSRQISNTSSAAGSSVAGSHVSGSENWETYTDASEADEADAHEAYLARAQAQQPQQTRPGQKRPSPGPTGPGARKRMATDDSYGGGPADGNEAAWTDLGEVY